MVCSQKYAYLYRVCRYSFAKLRYRFAKDSVGDLMMSTC
jgi:hypothetical protein